MELDPTDIEVPGTIVTFDFEPGLDESDGVRGVAIWAPGAMSDDRMIDWGWVDSYGGGFITKTILVSNPRIEVRGSAIFPES
jgi:hypothetical protein